MPAPSPSGSVFWGVDPKDCVEKWRARVRLPDGSRPTISLEGVPRDKPDVANAVAIEMSYMAKERAVVAASGGELVEEYAERWVGSREGKIGTAKTDRGRLRNHVLGTMVRSGRVPFGKLAMCDVTRSDVEDIVNALDEKVASDDEQRFGWKSAANAWTNVTKMFDDAKNHKDRGLRIRPDSNPCHEVRGPDTGQARAKSYLYPSEFLKLMACEALHRWRRDMYAVGIYTYARAGEMEALLVSDVDIEHGVIEITKAINRENGQVKSTKSGSPRRVPIEPGLLPILRRLVKDRPAGEALLRMPPAEDRAELLRKELAAAGVTRAGLYLNDARHKWITFHDLRATGITWAAVRGDDHLKIMQRAGHQNSATSMIYIREAENLRSGFGDVFPPLVQSLDADWTSEVVSTRNHCDPNGNRTTISISASAENDRGSSQRGPVVVGSNPTSGPDILGAVTAAMKAGRFDLAEQLLAMARVG